MARAGDFVLQVAARGRPDIAGPHVGPGAAFVLRVAGGLARRAFRIGRGLEVAVVAAEAVNRIFNAAAPRLDHAGAAHARHAALVFDARWHRLVDLNQAALDFLRDALGVRTRLVHSSELAVEGARAELILNVCKAVGARTLLAGFGGSRGYLDPNAFSCEGVTIEFHQFEHPVYPQCGPQPFIKGLSSIDLLFNCGSESGERLLGPRPVAKAA